MSLILDALNRSRQESDAVPGIDAHHPVTEIPVRTPLIVVSAALMVALVVIGWLILARGEAKAPGAPTQPAVAVKVPAPEPASQPAVVPEPAVQAGRAAAIEEPPPQTQRRANTPPPVPDPGVEALYSKLPPAEEKAATTAPAQRQPLASSTTEIIPRRSDVEEEELNVDALVRQAESDLANTQLDAHPAPFLSQLSQHTKDGIPTLLYSAHAYSGKPGQSSVVINGQQLKAGGSPAAGVKIIEILPDSVVLSFRGDDFRLRALNSWVNL